MARLMELSISQLLAAIFVLGLLVCRPSSSFTITQHYSFIVTDAPIHLLALSSSDDTLGPSPVEDAKTNNFGLQSLIDCIKNPSTSSAIQHPTEAAHLFHGRGGLFPGCEHLTLDWFPPVWLLTSYNQPLDEASLSIIQDTIQEQHDLLIKNESSEAVCTLVYQHRSQTNSSTEIVSGHVPRPHIITEQGLQFYIQVERARNHGIFLDMAAGRQWVRQYCAARQNEPTTVLNLFAYICGFSVAALQDAGSSTTVVNIDMVQGVLKTGQRNHELNQCPSTTKFLSHNIFKSWGKLKKLGPYELIIADPPTFQKSSFVAAKDYGKVVRRIPQMLAHDSSSRAVLCLNAPELDTEWLKEVVQEEAPELEFVRRLENPPTFASRFPEKGLKVLIYKWSEEGLDWAINRDES